MLGIDSEDTIEEGEVTDLIFPSPDKQALEDATLDGHSMVLPPSNLRLSSGQSKKMKNKQRSSSGKKNHTHRHF